MEDAHGALECSLVAAFLPTRFLQYGSDSTRERLLDIVATLPKKLWNKTSTEDKNFTRGLLGRDIFAGDEICEMIKNDHGDDDADITPFVVVVIAVGCSSPFT